MSDQNRLRIAVQKSGRLNEGSMRLLKAIGVKLSIRDRLLVAHSTNLPIDLLRVRDDDIPWPCYGWCGRPWFYWRK